MPSFFVKQLKFIILFISTVLLFAASLSNAAGWHSNIKITGVYMTSHNHNHGDSNHGGAWIKVDRAFSSSACGQANRDSFFFNVKTPKEKAWFSMAMAAFMSSSNVELYIENSCGAYNTPYIGEFRLVK